MAESYFDYMYGSKLNAPEDMKPSYSGPGYEPAGSSANSVSQGAGGETNAASLATAGASGAALGGPVGAGIAVGGQFLTTYLANKAASERARRERAAQIEQQYGENQNKGYDTMMRAFQGALR